jgi:adenylate cyclase
MRTVEGNYMKLTFNKTRKPIFLLLIWIFNGLYFSAFQYFVNKPSPFRTLLGIGDNALSFPIILLTVLSGLIIGGIEMFTASSKDLKMSLGKVIVFKAFLYIGAFIAISISFLVYLRIVNNDVPNFRQLLEESFKMYTSMDILFIFLTWFSIFGVSLLFLYANDKFTPKYFFSYLFGKYHKPRIENRIFMFLDLKSSTTIAERLGAVKYHDFLFDFYYTITEPIIKREGEIYQYVGDEISVTWNIKTGIKENNCINCFFDITDIIEKSSEFFFNKYGFVPEFKAGFHCGETVVGEIGVIKSEITFSGDVVNTTARIQELCNPYKQKVLISRELLNILFLEEDFKVKQIGALYLRGKNSETSICSINREVKEIACPYSKVNPAYK